MVNFIVLDLTFLVLFIIFATIFLSIKRKNLGSDGSLILYRTQWGVKLINYVGKRYKKTLKALSYISITMGYILMVSVLILIAQTVYIYLTTPIAKVIRAPPIMPLIPYFPQLFGLESFFPPFYFIYFIFALIIVASVHEFSHGIFAKRYNIKIKSTGFAFFKYFPALFGAFVEQDEKQMRKKKRFEQMAVLSAGVFANILVTILFFVIIALYFSLSFSAGGIMFDTYSYSIVNISDITKVNGLPINGEYQNILNKLYENDSLNNISTDRKDYLAKKSFFESQDYSGGKVVLYDNSPARKYGIGGVITEINGVKIRSLNDLANELKKYSPNEEVEIKTIKEGGEETEKIILDENPDDKTKVWLGIGFMDREKKGVFGKIYSFFSFFKEEYVYYSPKHNWSVFVYDLFWWIILINLAVALFNMLPLGFLDGGRFFYLTILSLTKSKKITEKAFAGATYLLLFLLLTLMIKWILVFF